MIYVHAITIGLALMTYPKDASLLKS